LTLEDDVAARLQAEARRTGRPFKAIVNEHLRRSLAQRSRPKSTPAFRVQPQNLGGAQPGHTYDAIGALLDELEGPRRR